MSEPTLNLTVAQIREIIQEIKKPSAEEAEKLAEAKKLKERAKAEKIETIRMEAEAKARVQNNCGHRKPNGESTVMGQIHSDGKRHPICFRCGKEFEPVTVPMDQLVLG